MKLRWETWKKRAPTWTQMNRLGYNFNNPNNEIEFCVTFFCWESWQTNFFPPPVRDQLCCRSHNGYQLTCVSPLIGQLSQILWSDWPRIHYDTIMTHEEKWSNIAFALQGPVNNWLHHSVINPADQGRNKADCDWSVLEETSILIGQDILTFRPTHQEDWLERGATMT